MDYRQVRDAIAAERAKLPAVDHNGRPVDPAPQSAAAAPEPAGPRNPAPDPSQGVRGVAAPPRADVTSLPTRQQNVARISQIRDEQLDDMRARGYRGGYPGTRWHIPDDAA